MWVSVVKTGFLNYVKILEYSGCHRIPERSFFYKGNQFPVCARCTGVFAGQHVAIITLLVACVFAGFKITDHLFYLFLLSIACMTPMLIDWTFQEYFGNMSNNKRRFVTGIVCGFGTGSIYYAILGFVIAYLLTFV